MKEIFHKETDTAEAMLQLKRGKKDRMLFGKLLKFILFVKELVRGSTTTIPISAAK